MAWQIGAGLGLGALSGLAGNSGQGGLFDTSRSRLRWMRDHITKRYRDMQDDYAGYYGAAREDLGNALGSLQSGYDTARREAGQAGQAARQHALDGERRMAGSGLQSLVSRGLSGSGSAASAMSRSIASDTNRRLLDIESSLASIYSGLATQKGQAEAGVHGNLANLNISEYGARRGAQQDYLDWMLTRGTGVNPQRATGANTMIPGLLGGLGWGLGEYQNAQQWESLKGLLGG